MTATTQTTDAAQRILDHLELRGHNAAVIGMQYGDEGKGQLTDLLAGAFDVVARYNGGANAGHSVHIGDQKFALHLIPSGILNPAAVNVVGNGVVIDPQQMLKEIDGLRERGVEVGDNLRVSNRAHVVMPYHKVQDRLYDHGLARAVEGSCAIGTTGRGIGPTYADKALRSTAIRMGMLLQPDALRAQLERVVWVKNVILKALAEACGESFEPFSVDELFEQCIAYGKRLAPHICDTMQLLHRSIADGKQLLFEGANATLLDIDHGTYPYVTSSNCSAVGIHSGTGLPARHLDRVIGVVKMYTSRVGGGPFTTELHDQTGQGIRDRGKEYGTTTGRPRRCGWLDLVPVRYGAQLSGATAICTTGLAVLSGIEKLKICVGYQKDGEQLDAYPADAAALVGLEPIYEELDGFSQPIGDAADFAELPDAARAYVQYVEDYVGVPVKAVCVGPKRSQILLR